MVGAALALLLGCDAQRFESIGQDAGTLDETTAADAASNSSDAPRVDAATPEPNDGSPAASTTDSGTTSVPSESDATSDEGAVTSDPTDDPELEPQEAGAISEDAASAVTEPDWDASTALDAGTDDTSDVDGSVVPELDGGTHTTDPLDSSLPGISFGDASDCDAEAGCAHDASTRDGAVDASDAADAADAADSNVDPSDECPKHPEQTLRGSCGCGFEPDEVCTLLEEGLTHRYRFDGEGDIAFDSVGDADGEIHGGVLDGEGNLDLDGLNDYVSLPANVPLESTDVTFEIWLTWHGGDDWQRIFDFGSLANNGDPKTYIYLSPRGGAASGKQALLFAHSTNGSGNTAHVHGDTELPTDQVSHVAVVLNTMAKRVALYTDGTRLGSADFDHSLNDFADTINSIGRSIFDDDPYLDATLHEFRIYGRSLTESQVQKSYALGPDTTYSQAE